MSPLGLRSLHACAGFAGWQTTVISRKVVRVKRNGIIQQGIAVFEKPERQKLAVFGW
jgi:hypothetical protein